MDAGGDVDTGKLSKTKMSVAMDSIVTVDQPPLFDLSRPGGATRAHPERAELFQHWRH
jgi:hypothetical protein